MDKEIRNARLLANENDFLINRLIEKKPYNMRKPIKKQYAELLKHGKYKLVDHLSWSYDGQSLEQVMGLDGSIPSRLEEIKRLGGVSKQAIAYFIIKRQFETYDFLND